MAGDHRTYAENLIAELDGIAGSYADILASSGIKNIDPNRGLEGTGIFFATSAHWGWTASDDDLEAARMALLERIRNWTPRFRLLFPHPTREVQKRIDNGIKHLISWLIRERKDGRVPPTIPEAQEMIAATVADLRKLLEHLPADDYAKRLIVDTNALIDDPNLAAYTRQLGGKYAVHLLPVVLREIDDLKRAGRNEAVREGARRADRRLKGIRNNGDPLEGVCVAGDVIVKFEHIEPRGDDLPDWLDMTVPDDRLVASALLLQSKHPGSALNVATSDINLQTKLAAVGIPFVEPSGGD